MSPRKILSPEITVMCDLRVRARRLIKLVVMRLHSYGLISDDRVRVIFARYSLEGV